MTRNVGAYFAFRMIDCRRVGEASVYSANWLADMRGSSFTLYFGVVRAAMEDIYLSESISDDTIFVTPLSNLFYRQAGAQGLGGSEGYFICSSSAANPEAGFEILAKAATADAAERIFRALVSFSRQSHGVAL